MSSSSSSSSSCLETALVGPGMQLAAAVWGLTVALFEARWVLAAAALAWLAWRWVVRQLVLKEFQVPSGVPRVALPRVVGGTVPARTIARPFGAGSSGKDDADADAGAAGAAGAGGGTQKKPLSMADVSGSAAASSGQDVGKTITAYDPASHQRLDALPIDDAAAVAAKAVRARAAQKEWAKTSFAERRRVLRALKAYVLAHKDDVVQSTALDTGKTQREGVLCEVYPLAMKIDWLLDHGEAALAPQSRSVPLSLSNKTATLEYKPHGLVALIVPSNFPFFNVMSHVVDTLFSGNACLFKLSEWGCWSAPYIENLVATVLEACGHSRDLALCCTGLAATGEAMIDESDTVLFIGSTTVGRLVQERAAQTLTKVTLELGGKDAYIVCPDANIPKAVAMALIGALTNCGQACIAAERFFVYEEVYEEFRDQLLAEVSNLIQGKDSETSHSHCGAILVPSWKDRYDLMVRDAVAKGAKILIGGVPGRAQGLGKKNADDPAADVQRDCDGTFYPPTIIEGVTQDMLVAKEETFGPLLCLMAPVKSDEDCIARANECDFGLGMCLWTHDSKRSKRILDGTNTGMAVINDYGYVVLVGSLPFGGVGASGHGSFGGPEGLRDFCYTRSIVDDWVPNMIPPSFALAPAPRGAHNQAAALTDILASGTWSGRIGGIAAFIRAALGKK